MVQREKKRRGVIVTITKEVVMKLKILAIFKRFILLII